MKFHNRTDIIEGVSIEREAVDYLAQIVDGDARAALNNLELVLNSARVDQKRVTVGVVGEVVEKTKVRYCPRFFDQVGHQTTNAFFH